MGLLEEVRVGEVGGRVQVDGRFDPRKMAEGALQEMNN
jgi:hypothetical protein